MIDIPIAKTTSMSVYELFISMIMRLGFEFKKALIVEVRPVPGYQFQDHKEAIQFLAKLKIEPYWDSASNRPLFRGIAGVNRRYKGVTRQSIEKGWPLLINTLGLNSREDTDQVRQEVRSQLKPK